VLGTGQRYRSWDTTRDKPLRQKAKCIQARFHPDYPEFSLDVDLDLPGRGVTALFGHSGSGKTTLLRLIAGLIVSRSCARSRRPR
jgi:ABC-type bacteriocin/lantibiotic exporter with double-glycine peptidase domain